MVCEGLNPPVIHEVKSANSTNNFTHLNSQHKLHAEHPTVLSKIAERDHQPKIADAFAASKKDQDFLDYMLLYAVPIQRCQDELFRTVHPYASASRVTMRARLVAHSQVRQQQAIDQLKHKTVTLAIDGGTIWKKYFCCVALAHRQPPLVLSVIAMPEMTSAIMQSEVERLCSLLLKHSVVPLGITCDNASNMDKLMRSVPLLMQRCAAHSIQLCVNDAFTVEPLASVWRTAKRILAANGKSEPPPTRWSGKYLAIVDIMQSTTYDVSCVDCQDFNSFLPAARALKPFYDLTQAVQSNNATMLTAAAMAHWMLCEIDHSTPYSQTLQEKSMLRSSFLLTEGVLVCAFFHPGVNRAKIEREVKDKIFNIVRSTFRGITSDDVLSEWATFRIEQPRGVEANVFVDVDQYALYWSKTHYDNLASAICRVIRANPSEAEAERTFSAIKFAFPRLRQSSNEDLVSATSIGMSAIGFLRGLEFNGVDDPTRRIEKVDDDVSPTAPITHRGITGIQAMALIKQWKSSTATTTTLEGQVRAKRGRKESEICGICKKNDAFHGPDARWVKCTTCATWYAFECAGIDEEDWQLVEQSETWTCSDCKTFNP